MTPALLNLLVAGVVGFVGRRRAEFGRGRFGALRGWFGVWEARAEAAWLCGDDSRAVAEAGAGLKLVTAHSDPWVPDGLARWVCLAGGRPPSVPAAGPFVREIAGDWRGAIASWEERGCTYAAALDGR